MTDDLLVKLKNLGKIPEVLRKQLNAFYDKSIPTEDQVKMGEFVFKNNFRI